MLSEDVFGQEKIRKKKRKIKKYLSDLEGLSRSSFFNSSANA